jgi:hypothetical protein
MADIDKVYEEAKAELMPFESWERLPGESGTAYSAFCAFRDYGLERNIRKAVEAAEKDGVRREKRYRVWLNWAAAHRWKQRVEDYDRCIEQLKQKELRKTIEAQGEMHRAVTGKMLDVVKKKLDAMNPAELSQGNLTEWVQTAIKAELEAAGLAAYSGRTETKQGEVNFTLDFQGL